MPKVDRTELLDQTSPVILSCISRLALSPAEGTRKGLLDFSQLPSPNPTEQLEDLRIAAILDVFGCETSFVTHLDLSSNNLQRESSPVRSCQTRMTNVLPEFPHWTVFPFRDLRLLDVTNNPSLEYLPLRLMTLPHLRRIRLRGTALRPDESISRLAYRSKWKPLGQSSSSFQYSKKGSHSLLYFIVTLMLAHDPMELGDFPPHLSELVSGSYLCALCGEPQIHPGLPRVGSWMAGEADFAWGPARPRIGEEFTHACGIARPGSDVHVHLRGRICRKCHFVALLDRNNWMGSHPI